MKTAKEVLEGQMDEAMCWFDFDKCAERLREVGWLRALDELEVAPRLREKALKVMRSAISGALSTKDQTTDKVYEYETNLFPFLATVTLCREKETWARLDLTCYVERTLNEGEECSI